MTLLDRLRSAWAWMFNTLDFRAPVVTRVENPPQAQRVNGDDFGGGDVQDGGTWA